MSSIPQTGPLLTPEADRGIQSATLLLRDMPSTGAHLDWLQCAEVLSDDDCDEMIRVCREFPTVPSATVGEEVRPGRRRADIRKVGARPDTQWIFNLLGKVAAAATNAAYSLDLTAITRAPQYLEYEAGWGQFDWHNDYSHGLADAPRKLTIIIQLSAATDYDGGRLQMFGLEIEDLPTRRGTIIAFPSFLYHRVTPVTRGVRRALVAWIAGPRIR